MKVGAAGDRFGGRRGRGHHRGLDLDLDGADVDAGVRHAGQAALVGGRVAGEGGVAGVQGGAAGQQVVGLSTSAVWKPPPSPSASLSVKVLSETVSEAPWSTMNPPP